MKKITFSFFLVLTLYPLLGFAQNQDELSFLNIKTNFDSVYVILDKEISSISKLSTADEKEIIPGEHLVTVVPEFGPTYSFNHEFSPDSVHSAVIQFAAILDEQNPIYTKIESKDSTLQATDIEISSDLIEGYFEIKTYSKIEFEQKDIPRSFDFEDTYLKINSNVDSLYLKLNFDEGQVIRIANGDSIPYRSGRNLIRLSHQNAEEWSSLEVIEKGKTTIVEHNFDVQEPSIETLSNNFATKPFYGSNLFVITDKESRILINGRELGMGAAKALHKTGPVDIDILNPYTDTTSFTAKITNLPSEKGVVINAYTKPDKSIARIHSVIPGASQLYKDQRIKATLIGTGFVIFGSTAIQRNMTYNRELTEYKNIRKKYVDVWREERALELGNAMEEQHKVVNRINTQRQILFTLTSIIYAFNIYDAFFSAPKSGYREETDIEFYFQKNSIGSKSFTSMTLKYDF